MVGNLIGVFVLKAGVAGVAYPSLIARLFSAVVITVLCFQAKNPVTYSKKWIFRWDGQMMKNMLRIAIPNGAENGVFQLVKVALSSLVALFGTYQIAANGVAQSIWSHGGAGWGGHGARVYHRDRAVYGNRGRTGGRVGI